MAKNSGYIGRIPNSPTMKVEAPHQKVNSKNPVMKTGKDLRAGKVDKSKK